MKYLFQMMIIGVISFVGEALNLLLPMPVPASVYGLVILFICLLTGVIKLEQIEETADFFLVIMPILFVAPGISLMDTLPMVSDSVVAILAVSFVSTIITMVVTGVVSQLIIRLKRRKVNE